MEPYCCIIRHTARGVCCGISWREKACVWSCCNKPLCCTFATASALFDMEMSVGLWSLVLDRDL